MKTFALIRKRPDITRDAFREHYEEVHAPLAIDTLLEGVSRYVRYHVRDVLVGDPAFDVVTGFWYPNVEAVLEVRKRVAGAEGEAIARDELSFMDRVWNTFFPVSEHEVLGAEDPDAGLRVAALARAPEGAAREDFVAAYEAQSVPMLLGATRAPRWCLQNRAIRMGEERPAFDVVTQLHAAADAGLGEWARALAATGARVAVVTVSEHESALPW